MISTVTFTRSKSDCIANVRSPIPLRTSDQSILDLICGSNDDNQSGMSLLESEDSDDCLVLRRKFNSLGNLHSHSTRKNDYKDLNSEQNPHQMDYQDFCSCSSSEIPNRASNPLVRDPQFQEIALKNLRKLALTGNLLNELAM